MALGGSSSRHRPELVSAENSKDTPSDLLSTKAWTLEDNLLHVTSSARVDADFALKMASASVGSTPWWTTAFSAAMSARGES